MSTEPWKYYVRRLIGNGTEVPAYNGLPLEKVSLDRELSGPGGIKGSLPFAVSRGMVTEDGSPLFVPWATTIYAEKDGHIRHGGILADVSDEGPDLKLDCVGFTGYATGQPYTSEYSVSSVDPLAVFRHIWAHLQGQPGGNLGLQIDNATSPIRVGVAKESGGQGPYVLGWWETHDLGKVLDELATLTPFDYVVDHEWDGEKVLHRVRIGYPTIGRRRDDLRFVVGENIFDGPLKVSYAGDDYADTVLLLGAGEGRKMIRGFQYRPARTEVLRLRRTVVVEDKSITTAQKAEQAAMDELSYRLGEADLTSLTVKDHPHAPVGSYDVGDEIRVRTPKGWHAGLDIWVRILAISTDPQTNSEELTVLRSEKGTR